jgi:hypothetical protein
MSLLIRLPFPVILLTLALAFVSPSRASDSPLAPDAPFADSENIKAWAEILGGKGAPSDYSSWLDSRWSYMNRVRLNAMRGWGSSALGGADSSTVFYPFSGPDVLYADTLFPDSKILLMAGLEPVGTMPDLAKLKADGKLDAYLGEVKISLQTILSASFFKTKDMKNDFNNEMVNGLLPAMIVFISREGHSIDNLQYVTLGHDGTVHPRGTVSGSSGVQISYAGKTVLYFETNLANDGLQENPGYIRLMKRLSPGVTYLKAASYLLYEDYFSTIRNAILDDSSGVVEDDSGIPFRYFDPKEWEVVPYGNYTGPIPLFAEHYQHDLADYYAKTSHSSLAFGSGYKFVASVSSLLVAKKK